MLIMLTLPEGEVIKKDARIEDLISKMAEGDTSAMGGLYELIKTDVYAYALSRTADTDFAEDVTHDTFVRIYKYARQYKPSGKPLAWIFTIEMNIIRRERELSGRVTELDERIDVGDGGDTSERIVENSFLYELLRHLSEDEREIISLHVVSGLKHREIAGLLGKPLSTVLSKYQRAIVKLRKISNEGGDLK